LDVRASELPPLHSCPLMSIATRTGDTGTPA
jgi:hypothetical protein